MKDLCLRYYVRWDCYYKKHWRTRTVNFVVYLWTPLACDERLSFPYEQLVPSVRQSCAYRKRQKTFEIDSDHMLHWCVKIGSDHMLHWCVKIGTDHMLHWCVKIDWSYVTLMRENWLIVFYPENSTKNELFTILYLLTLLTCGVCFTASGVIKVQDIHFSTWRAKTQPGWKRCAYVKHQKSFESWQLCVTLVS